MFFASEIVQCVNISFYLTYMILNNKWETVAVRRNAIFLRCVGSFLQSSRGLNTARLARNLRDCSLETSRRECDHCCSVGNISPAVVSKLVWPVSVLSSNCSLVPVCILSRMPKRLYAAPLQARQEGNDELSYVAEELPPSESSSLVSRLGDSNVWNAILAIFLFFFLFKEYF